MMKYCVPFFFSEKVLGEECSPGNVIQCASTKAECLEHQSAVYKCTCSSSYYDDNGLGLGGTCQDSKLDFSDSILMLRAFHSDTSSQTY